MKRSFALPVGSSWNCLEILMRFTRRCVCLFLYGRQTWEAVALLFLNQRIPSKDYCSKDMSPPCLLPSPRLLPDFYTNEIKYQQPQFNYSKFSSRLSHFYFVGISKEGTTKAENKVLLDRHYLEI